MIALLRLAWRESRTLRRRLLLSTSAIALGVAALVAVDSLATNIRASVRDNSRALLGGDLSLTARSPLSGESLRDGNGFAPFPRSSNRPFFGMTNTRGA